MAEEPKKRQLKNAAQQLGVDPDDLAKMLELPEGYKLTTPVQMALAQQLVEEARGKTVDLSAPAPTASKRSRRSRRRSSRTDRGQRGSRKPKMSPEERAARQVCIDWLVSVQEECARLAQLERDGDPFIPSMDELEQLTDDRTKVRFSDPFALHLGDANLKRVLPYAAIRDARENNRNIPLFSSLLKEKVRDALQDLVPTTCPCGMPLRLFYQVTEQDAQDFLRLRRQVPGGYGLRGPALHRYQMEDHHPECRHMEEEWVTLEFELSKMGGDTPEAVAHREARYTSLLDETLVRYEPHGATRATVLRAFEVFIQQKPDSESTQASEVGEVVGSG